MRKLTLKMKDMSKVNKYIPEDNTEFDFDEDEEEIEIPEPEEVSDSLEIDLGNLHKEAEKIPLLFRKYSRVLKQKRMLFHNAKRRRKAVESELALKIRQNPKDYDLKVDRVTDKIVDLVIQGHSKYQRAKRKENNLEVEVMEWQDVLESVRIKSHNIRTAYEMWQDNYWGDIHLKEKKGGR